MRFKANDRQTWVELNRVSHFPGENCGQALDGSQHTSADLPDGPSVYNRHLQKRQGLRL
jgi:hypothetical protein